MKTYLHGFAYFGKSGTAVECVVNDISDSGARLKFTAAPPIVDTVELHIPSKGRVNRAKVLWRAADELGVGSSKTLPRLSDTSMNMVLFAKDNEIVSS
jgi:hypothetical protein